MKKTLLLLLMVFMAVSSSWAYTLPTSTMDLKTITASTMGTWQDQKSYDLSDDWLVVSGYASYKSVGTGKQTWITQTSAGNSASSWNTLSGEPFKGSSYYTTASYTTIQSGRNLVYRVKNCKSVKVYGKNNSTTRYIKINFYEVNDGAAATSAVYTLSNTSTDEQVWNQTLDGSKEYVVDIEAVGSSNSRIFEVAFERNVVADTRKEPQLSLSETEFEAHAGDAEFTEPTVSSAGGYKGSYTYSSDKPAVASVNATTGEVTIGIAGKATITVSVPEGDENYKPRSVSYTITVFKVAPVGATFYESFDLFNGDGGNDGVWTGITTTKDLGTFDNTGWTTEGTNYSGYQCVSIRKSGEDTTPSGLTTPEIGVAGDGHVKFDVESWGEDGSVFYVEIVGGGTFATTIPSGVSLNSNTTAKVTLAKTGTWTTYDIPFKNLTANSKFRFYAPAKKRAFLDEVAVFVTPTTGELEFVANENGTYYATFSSHKAVAMPQLDEDNNMFIAYAVSVDNNGSMTLTDIASDMKNVDDNDNILIPANTGVLVEAVFDGENPHVMTYSFTSVDASANYDADFNMLRPASAEKETEGFKFYKLAYASSNKDGLGFYWGAANGAAFTSREGSAYLAVPTGPAAKSGFKFNDDEATGINNVKAEVATGVAYNLAGQRVNATVKGLVIMNGKKFINK